MKYKGDFNPQSVLDPESYEWNPLDSSMKARLDKQKYISPSREQRGVTYPVSASYIPTPPTPKQTEVNAESALDKVKELNEDGQANEDSEEEDAEEAESVALFDTGMPGILSKQEMLQHVDLDMINIKLFGAEYITSHLMSWAEEDIDQPNSLKALFAGFVAAVGPEIARKVFVHLGWAQLSEGMFAVEVIVFLDHSTDPGFVAGDRCVAHVKGAVDRTSPTLHLIIQPVGV